MGFKSLTHSLANVAMNVVGDLKVTVAYTRVSGPMVYDPATDQQVNTTSTISFKGLLTNQSVNEYDYAKMPDNHLKLIINTDAINFEPAENDKCVINGRNYEVKRIKYVPGDPIYIIYIQQV